MELIAEKIREWIHNDFTYEEICQKIPQYQQRTGLMFMLESLQNLANNGRVNKIVAKAAGILGIRAVGKASDVGTLQPLEKCRGEKKATTSLLAQLTTLGYEGGKVRINHCMNENAAQGDTQLPVDILSQFDIIRTDRNTNLSSGCRMHSAEIGLGSPDP
jgi:fatty acid-binding protein DegV